MPLTESPAEGRLVDIGDTRLFVVEKSQEGYPLICLHALRRDHWSFAEYLDGLGPEVKVVLPDLRGHGMSDPADAVTMRQLVDDVAALARALELERFALLAHGDSATIALAATNATHVVLVGPDADDRIDDPEYARRTAPAVDRPDLAIEDDLEVAPSRAPDLVFDSRYAFVEDQARFRAQILGMISRS